MLDNSTKQDQKAVTPEQNQPDAEVEALESEGGDLEDLAFGDMGCGGGDPYIARLVQQAREEGAVIEEVRSRDVSREQREFKPPGYEHIDDVKE